MGESKTSARRLKAAERRQKALEMRKLGFSYEKIAQLLGISRQAAYKAVKKAFQEIERDSLETLEEVRRLELERLDEWQLKIEREMKGGKVLAAVDRGLKIMDRRSKLLRLKPPEKGGRNPYRVLEEERKAVEDMTDEELVKELSATSFWD